MVRIVRCATLLLGMVLSGGCSLLPSEFNLSPLYRHRLDEKGAVLELDVLWPIVHFETRADGGSDFRIRPFYRRVAKPELEGFDEPAAEQPRQPAAAEASAQRPATATDHQFLWPLGRVRNRARETHARLFPLFNYDGRTFNDGRSESDWYLFFPFLWGGSDQAGPDEPARPYFGIFPLYLDAPGEFLTYDRFTTVLWPLYTRTEKDGRTGHILLWPFIGFSEAKGEDQTIWRRVLPLFNYIARPGEFARYSVLWPLIHWGTELLDTKDPLRSFSLFPLFSWQGNETVLGWSFLWPFFRGHEVEGKQKQLDLFWPFYHSYEEGSGDKKLKQWWLWPLASRTVGPYQKAWSVLWPLIWWRQYKDPDGVQTQRWLVPFYKHIHREWTENRGEDDYLQVWPLFHTDEKHDGTGEWRFPSPWFYRDGNEEGVSEAYGWLYTVAQGRKRARDDHAVHTAAHIFTTRTRGGRTQTSVPLLFSYESNADQSTLYLFNLIPLRLGGVR